MKIPNNIMDINELVKMIEEMEYIDCKKDDYNDVTYESIMFYLNFCKGWFVMQQIDKLKDEILNGKSDKEPKGLFKEEI